MITLLRTNSKNSDFIELVKLLDADLAIRDGAEDHAFYAQFNKIDLIQHVIVASQNESALGCGAFKFFDADTAEIKRMYVKPEHRGKGIAFQVLVALEFWAKEVGFKKCILETGYQQPEAIALYKKSGYQIIPNYGQYAGVENSVCFAKLI
ncbi:MAG: GNAT family N-acetyltransferase [Sphingobacteriales bacterium]|nr:GNAT family N-acetyltransferase [Sphingobacteriales bacterium]